MRYLPSTIDVVLTFNGSGIHIVMDVYSDADFANGVSLKSVSGMVLRMYGNCVFWRSMRQDIIAWDTTEAELIAMSSAANELMWIKQLCTDFSITAKKPTLWGDDKSANLFAVNPISSDRSNYIRVRHLSVREYVEHDEMDVQFVGTKEMLAEGFTKAFPGLALSDLRDKLLFRKSLWRSVVTYAHYACVADCADAMADAWEDSAGCAQSICLQENLLKCQYIVKWGLHEIVHI